MDEEERRRRHSISSFRRPWVDLERKREGKGKGGGGKGREGGRKDFTNNCYSSDWISTQSEHCT